MSKVRAFLAELDARDGHIYGGIALIGAGASTISLATALLAVGGLLLALGLIAPYLRSR